jgi:hypothetical protein
MADEYTRGEASQSQSAYIKVTNDGGFTYKQLHQLSLVQLREEAE